MELSTDRGNTLITEGSDGRLLEVTPTHDIVWEYISPNWGKQTNMNMVYLAFRVSYGWVPQLDVPEENPITPPDVTRFRFPGAAAPGERRVIETKAFGPITGSKRPA